MLHTTRILRWLLLALMLSACADLIDASINNTPEQALIEQVSAEMALLKDGLGTLRDYCGSVNTNPPAEDAYTAALPGVMSHLLADARSRNFSFEQLRHIFILGAQYTDVYFYPSDETDNFLVAIRSFVCMASTERPSHYVMFVMNRKGESWRIGSVGFSPDYSQVKWAGDRWVVVYDQPDQTIINDLRLWHIGTDGDGWHVTLDFPLESDGAPSLWLDENYQRIRLRFLRYGSDPPLCDIDPALTDDASYVQYVIDKTLIWENDTYRQIDEAVVQARIGDGITTTPETQVEGDQLMCVNLGAEARLAESIRADIPIPPDRSMPHANPCETDYDPTLVEDYNTAIVRALAKMLTEPEAQGMDTAQLQTAFNRVATVYALFEGSENYLAVFIPFDLLCAPGSRYIPPIVLYGIEADGNFTRLDMPDGTFYGINGIEPHWVEDRWVTLVNNNVNLCQYCYAIWHIIPAESGWTVTSALKLGEVMNGGEAWLNRPKLELVDGYNEITLTLQPQYIDPPCTFDAETTENIYMIWRTIRREYALEDGIYQLKDETPLETHVVLYAPDDRDSNTPPYVEPERWQDLCVGE
jgi:hypothetical protein